MTPFSSEELNELAAGYVLGDLTSEEAALFQQRLQEDALLKARVAQLQKTLGMMALGVPSQEPSSSLRSRILQTVDPTASPSPKKISKGSNQTHPDMRGWFTAPKYHLGRRSRWIGWGVGATVIAIAFSAQQHQLQQQIAMLETALSHQQPWPAYHPAKPLPFPAETTLTIEAPAELLAQQWPGLQRLSQDHQQSHIQDLKPGQRTSQETDATPKQQFKHLTPSLTMPRLVEQSEDIEAQFLGMTPCQMGKIQGLRMTYLLDQKTMISVYKLERGEEFPLPGTKTMSLQNPEGLSMVLWEKDSFLYAIVSDLPINRIKDLVIAS